MWTEQRLSTRRDFLCRQFTHVGVAGRRKLFSLRQVPNDGLVFTKALDDRLDFRSRLRVLSEFGRIALDLGRSQQTQELVIALLDRSQFIEHNKFRFKVPGSRFPVRIQSSEFLRTRTLNREP